jgi:hypothetical protein
MVERLKRPLVGARLAGEGALESVFAGKPGSYRNHVYPVR